jgi:hypothetical protein
MNWQSRHNLFGVAMCLCDIGLDGLVLVVSFLEGLDVAFLERACTSHRTGIRRLLLSALDNDLSVVCVKENGGCKGGYSYRALEWLSLRRIRVDTLLLSPWVGSDELHSLDPPLLLHKIRSIRLNSQDTCMIRWIVDRCPLLEEVVFDDRCMMTSGEIVDLLGSLVPGSLRSLDLNHHFVRQSGILELLVSRFPRLRSVGLNGWHSPLTEPDLGQLCRLESLTSLQLHSIKVYSREFARQLGGLLCKKGPWLESVSISASASAYHDSKAEYVDRIDLLVEGLGVCLGRLTRLDLDMPFLSRKTLAFLMEGLSRRNGSTSLRRLSLEQSWGGQFANDGGGLGVGFGESYLGVFAGLEYLCLSNVSWIDAWSFSGIGRACRSLRELFLDHVAITDEGMVGLLENNRSLETFYVIQCEGISSRSIECLSRHCSNLSWLFLCDCGGVDPCPEWIQRILEESRIWSPAYCVLSPRMLSLDDKSSVCIHKIIESKRRRFL